MRQRCGLLPDRDKLLIEVYALMREHLFNIVNKHSRLAEGRTWRDIGDIYPIQFPVPNGRP